MRAITVVAGLPGHERLEERRWLERMITRRVLLGRWSKALTRRPYDIKTTIVFG